MTRAVRFNLVDVFTDVAFAGNQLGVFTDSRGLSGEQMQTLAAELGFSECTFVLPPEGNIGPVDAGQRRQIIQRSLVYGHYEREIDRESAYEKLKSRAQQEPPETPMPAKRVGRQPEGLLTAKAKSTVRSIGSSVGRQIVRGILGSIFGGRR